MPSASNESRNSRSRVFLSGLGKRQRRVSDTATDLGPGIDTRRILVLMTDTGGGHRASAEALKMAFQERYGDRFQVDIVDLWMKHTPWPLNQIPKTYRFMVSDAPRLWKFLYEMGENPKATKQAMKAVYRWTHRTINKAISSYDPDLVIAVHPLLQEIPLRVLARLKHYVPFVTVVTDLSTIPVSWFNPDVTLCFVASDRAYLQGLQMGMDPAQMRTLGLPIRPVFGRESRPKALLRQQLAMDPELPAALLVGGGEGMGPVADVARTLAIRLAGGAMQAKGPMGQLVIICGRNRKLEQELKEQLWPIPTIINGFVGNMNEWMAACDCIITKAGPGTIAEALACGLPVLLFSYVAGQEEGNVPYVIANGVGTYCEDPKLIAEIVGRWFGPGQEEMEAIAQRARALGHPQATFQIVEEIARLLE
jgi:1,2-diacylglycerol 3-beta-galactosyltransferase